MAKKKDSLILYYGLYEDLKNLNKTEIADVIMAIFDYEINGVIPEFRSRSARIVFRNAAKVLDVNRQKYEEICELNRTKAKIRWHGQKNDEVMPEHTAAYSGIKNNAENADTDTVYVTEKETYKDTYNDNVYVNEKDTISSSEEGVHTHKKQYGLFSNVSLDEGEYAEFIRMYPSDYQQRIDSMSSYMKAQGKTYKNDFARLCSWKLLDKEEKKESKPKYSSDASYDIDAYMQQAIDPVYEKVN